ncbi:hypothetical protein [Enterococcus termitis]|nr:hypothetical protein [Enterococcus termitis]OJG98755.1 hypothetical protein RV18_GL002617 [Enterococcus termitis]
MMSSTWRTKMSEVTKRGNTAIIYITTDVKRYLANQAIKVTK